MKDRDVQPHIGWAPIILFAAAMSIARGLATFLGDTSLPKTLLDLTQLFMIEVFPSFLYSLVCFTVLVFGAELFTKQRTPTLSSVRLVSFILLYCIAGTASLIMMIVAFAGIPLLFVPKTALTLSIEFYAMSFLSFLPIAAFALAVRFKVPQPGNTDGSGGENS